MRSFATLLAVVVLLSRCRVREDTATAGAVQPTAPRFIPRVVQTTRTFVVAIHRPGRRRVPTDFVNWCNRVFRGPVFSCRAWIRRSIWMNDKPLNAGGAKPIDDDPVTQAMRARRSVREQGSVRARLRCSSISWTMRDSTESARPIGRVVQGMDVVDSFTRDTAINPTRQ